MRFMARTPRPACVGGSPAAREMCKSPGEAGCSGAHRGAGAR